MEGSAERRILRGCTFATPAPIPKWLQHMLRDWQLVGLITAWSAARGRTSAGWLNPCALHFEETSTTGSWFQLY